MAESPLEIARAIRRHFGYVIPIPHGKKGPVLAGWQHLRLEDADLPAYFGDEPTNYGLLLGASGIVDIDLDAPEARDLAPSFLPPTCVFGREGNPASHYLYRVEERRPMKRYQVGGETLLEYRDESRSGTPLQTVVPPSTHPDGDCYRYFEARPPEKIGAEELYLRAERLAAACAFARLWPRTAGVRHDVALALASVLLRTGLDKEEAARFIEAVARHAGDEEVGDRVMAVVSTATALAAGESTTGLPRLRELLCADGAAEKLLDAATNWLGLGGRADITERSLCTDSGAGEGDAGSASNAERKSQATTLVELAEEHGTELWHDAEQNAYVSFRVGDHGETHRLRSTQTKRWLSHLFYKAERRTPGAQGLEDALGVLEGRALFEGLEYRTAVRVAEVDVDGAPRIYLDLGNDSWEVVEVRAGGWGLIPVEACPIRFTRTSGMLPLPAPTPGGDAQALASLLNLDPEGPDLVLALSWLVQALRGRGPFPVLEVTGEQGSGKSTAARVLRSLIDPNVAPLRALPRSDHEAFISAANAHVLAFDNVSGFSRDVSDRLCRISTGGGLSVRALYTDNEERLFDVTKPQIINGIEDLAAQPDLADRTVALRLPRIDPGERRTETELKAALDDARPALLGALLDAVAGGLAQLPKVRLDALPRMADFAVWATACEVPLGFAPGAFMEAYDEGHASLVEAAVEGEPVAAAVRKLVEQGPYSGTPTGLLDALTGVMNFGFGLGKTRPPREWPRNARALSGKLKRLAPPLRARGIAVEFGHHGRGKDKERNITLEKIDDDQRPHRPPRPIGSLELPGIGPSGILGLDSSAEG